MKRYILVLFYIFDQFLSIKIMLRPCNSLICIILRFIFWYLFSSASCFSLFYFMKFMI